MANIVILGAGVMGSALAVPASSAHSVALVGSPLDDDIVKGLRENGHHSTLNVALPDSIDAVLSSDDNAALLANADVIVVGVSSPGVGWALDEINRYKAKPNLLALVTKGLVASDHPEKPPVTYAQHMDAKLTKPYGRVVGIGGPCIARELALKYPTRVSFASHDIAAANDLRDLFQTDYYRITTHSDFTELEACAALKNFMCIGVSAMFSAYELEDSYPKNPLAALFNQAVLELAILSRWIVENLPDGDTQASVTSQKNLPAFDLAGMGDLHVTVGGGRNSRLGRYLGDEQRLSQVLQGPMKEVTVEGVDTGRRLLPGFQAACASGALTSEFLPLTRAILASIDQDELFKFDFSSLPG